ncbi:CCR4-Not complex component, Not1 [Purpureocillium lavendulum]|uniref:CCR4-Not complex component, Not1 n=1 Tax=Purpureocillium lavendulum TaxID=1247861 RepID=A0AB34FUP3_9HYPO|nr:CCR4-Not complex component, Not1 [Purpureocillium lavendulum]
MSEASPPPQQAKDTATTERIPAHSEGPSRLHPSARNVRTSFTQRHRPSDSQRFVDVHTPKESQLVHAPYGVNDPYSASYFPHPPNAKGDSGIPLQPSKGLRIEVPPPLPRSKEPAPAETPKQIFREQPTQRNPSYASDALWSHSSKRDATIRLEIDIEEDVDSNIEEFVRLKRMGWFRKADDYFQECLSAHFQTPSVAVEYADMLLEQGFVRPIFEAIDDEAVTAACDAIPEHELAANHEDEINLLLVLHLARSRHDPDLPRAYAAAQIARSYLEQRMTADQDSLNPTEVRLKQRCFLHGVKTYRLVQVRILSRYLFLFRQMASVANLATPKDLDVIKGWKDWPRLYHTLLRESRHWDLRDVVLASVSAFGPFSACNILFGEYSIVDGVSDLISTWKKTECDDTSSLCLLDILTCFGEETVKMLDHGDTSVKAAKQFFFDQARAVATSIKETTPQHMKTRAYLHWILAEERHARIVDDAERVKSADGPGTAHQAFANFPGLTLRFGALPIYAPVQSENPGWPGLGRDAATLRPNDLLAVAVKVSEELHDYSTQAHCLQELICRSPDPEELFTKLENLYSSVTGNMLDLLGTRLSRYLLAVDDKSREALYKSLVELDPRIHIWSNFAHPVIEWCQRTVLHALLVSLGRDPEQARNVANQAQALFPLLPHNFFSKPYKAGRPRLAPAQRPRVHLHDPLDAENQTMGKDGRGTKARKKGATGGTNAGGQVPYLKGSQAAAYNLPPGLQRSRSWGSGPPSPPPAHGNAAYYPGSPGPRWAGGPVLDADSLAEFKALKAEKAKMEESTKMRERDDRIRLETEMTVMKRMDELKRAQEEAKNEIAKARAEAERAAREKIEAERRAEEERMKQQAEVMQRAEASAMSRFRAEMRAAEERRKREQEERETIEEAVRVRVEAAIRAEAEAKAEARAAMAQAEAEAKAAAAQKAAEEAEWRDKVVQEAKRQAEIDVRAAMEAEREAEREQAQE